MKNMIWETLYQEGHTQRYPWDSVVSFVFRNAPKNKNREDVRILEVGFGTGSNLLFAAKEGFCVSGIEGSDTAVSVAKQIFESEGISGDFCVGDFSNLPFESGYFDLVIDRAALTCVGKNAQQMSIIEIQRCMKPGGMFFHNCYADSHSSFRSGVSGPDGVIDEISEGSLVGVGQIFFSSRKDIDELFSDGWILHQVQRREWTEMLHPFGDVHAEWAVIAEKKTAS